MKISNSIIIPTTCPFRAWHHLILNQSNRVEKEKMKRKTNSMKLADAISVVRRGPQKAHQPQSARTAEETRRKARYALHSTPFPEFPSPLIFRFTRQKRRMNSCYPVGKRNYFSQIQEARFKARSTSTCKETSFRTLDFHSHPRRGL